MVQSLPVHLLGPDSLCRKAVQPHPSRHIASAGSCGFVKGPRPRIVGSMLRVEARESHTLQAAKAPNPEIVGAFHLLPPLRRRRRPPPPAAAAAATTTTATGAVAAAATIIRMTTTATTTAATTPARAVAETQEHQCQYQHQQQQHQAV